MFDPGGYSSRLWTAHFWEDDTRCFLGGSLNAAMVSETEEVLLSIGLQHKFQDKAKLFCTSYVITEDRYFPKARKQPDRVTAQGYGNCEG